MNLIDNFVVNGEERIIDTIVLNGVEYMIAGSGNRYPVTYELTGVTSSNTASTVKENTAFSTTLTAGTGLTIDHIFVTMNGVDVTESVYSSGTINIASVTGSILISASAVATVDSITISDIDSAFQAETEAVVSAINSAANNSVSFVVLTDTHGSSNGQKSQNIVRYILKNSRANKLFWLGDMSAVNWSTSEYETFIAPLLNCAEKVYPTVGNHEYFANPTGDLTDIYEDFLADKTGLTGLPTSFYYYFDDTAHKVRYVIINTSDGATNAVTSAQLEWLNNAVVVPDSTWKVISMAHFPVKRPSESSETVSNRRYAIRDALISTNGTNVAYICGHTHIDDTSVVDYSFYQQILLHDCVAGQAVSVVNVNLDTGLFHVYRIGTGEDIEFTYTNLPAMVEWNITNNLTGCQSSNTETTIISGRPYSATLTSLPNYSLAQGTVTVTMGGTDITSTAYNSSTGAISIAEVTGAIVITATALYVEPLEEYEGAWLVKNTSVTYPSFTYTSVADAVAGFPDYLAFIMCNQTTDWPMGFRGGSTNTHAYYSTRTSGWTTHTYEWKSDLRTAAGMPVATVDGKHYAFTTFTKAESDAAYALYQAAISGGEIDTGGSVNLLKGRTLDSGFEYWVIAENVTSDNIESIVHRLPTHESA